MSAPSQKLFRSTSIRKHVPFRYMVCTDRNGVIGVHNALPFRVPLDMARFRSTTEHPRHPKRTNGVLMGYRTWKSLPDSHRPLPNRLNMVLTRSPEHASEVRAQGAYPFTNVSLVLDFADSLHTTMAAVYVIGGAQIYQNSALRSRAQSIHWTMVDVDVLEDRTASPTGGDDDGDIDDPPNEQEVARFQVPRHFTMQDFEEVESWQASTEVTSLVSSSGHTEKRHVVFRTYCRTNPADTASNAVASLSTNSHQTPLHSAAGLSRQVSTLASPSHLTAEQQYLGLLRKVLETGELRTTRNSVTRSLFGERIVVNLSDGTVPLLTSKKMAWKTVLKELFWFVRGDTDNAKLQAQKVHIWDANASREFLDSRGLVNREVNDLGPVYGFQWRHFGAEYVDCHTDYAGHGVDQLEECRRLIMEDPNSRRILFTAWDPAALSQMALPPCHLLGQWYVKEDGQLWLQVYQRSGDLFLGVPFNLFSYSAMVHMMAHLTGKTPGGLVHIIGDAHIYANQEGVVQQQLERPTHKPPSFGMVDTSDVTAWEDFTMDSVELRDYVCEGSLKAPMVA